MGNINKIICIDIKCILKIILICFPFFLFIAEIGAFEKKGDSSEFKGHISVSKFEFIGGSSSLKAWGIIIPEVLKGYFVSYGWPVEDVSRSVEGKPRKPSYVNGQLYDNKVSGFSISGTFFESDGVIRIDTRLKNTKTGKIISKTKEVFNQNEFLSGMELLCKKLGIAIDDYVSKPIAIRKKSLVVKCFKFDKKLSLSKGKYGWIGKDVTKYLTDGLSQMKMIKVEDWMSVQKVCEDSIETIARRFLADVVITGKCKMWRLSEKITLSATINVIEEDYPIGPIKVKGRLYNLFDLYEELNESIEEILNGIITPNFNLKDVFAEDLDADEYLKRGNTLVERGNKALAVVMYRKALEENDKLLKAYIRLGIIFEENNNYEKAKEEFNEVLNLIKAKKVLKEDLNSKSDIAEAYFHLGDISFKMGEYDKAFEYYKDALGYEKTVEAYMKLGDVYLLDGKHDDALRKYKDAKKMDPKNADVYYSIGLIYSTQKKYDKAIGEYREVLKIDQSHSNAINGLSKAYYQKGEQLIRKGEDENDISIKKELYEQAVSTINNSIATKASPQAYSRLTWVYYDLWKIGNSKELLEKALGASKKAVELNPTYPWSQAGLGCVLVESGDYEKAIVALNEAIKLDPEHGFAQWYLGRAYKEIGDDLLEREIFEDAISNFKIAIKNLEDAWKISFDKREYKWEAKAMDLAVEIGSAVKAKGLTGEIKLDNSLFLARSGESYRMLGDYDTAINKLSKAIKVNPDIDAWIYAGLGEAYQAQKNYKDAIASLKKAVELNPASARSYAGLGKAYRAQGDYENAITNLKKAVELNPDNIWAYSQLTAIFQENIFNYPEAYKNAQKAFELEANTQNKTNLIKYESNMVETLFTNNKFDHAVKKAEDILHKTEDNVTALNMKFIQASGLLMQEENYHARSEIKGFTKLYKKFSLQRKKENAKLEKNTWSYRGILHFVETQEKLSDAKKNMLISMIRLLQNEIDVSEFEAAIEEFYNEIETKK